MLHLPFEVHGSGPGRTTLFALGSFGNDPVLARLDLFDRHGEWLGFWLHALAPRAVYPVNLRDVLYGPPFPVCEIEDQEELPSSLEDLVLNTSKVRDALLDDEGPEVLSGSIEVRAVPGCQPLPPADIATGDGALWGDTFDVEADNAFATGGAIRSSLPRPAFAYLWGVRFLGDPFATTEVEIHVPNLAPGDSVPVSLGAADEAGQIVQLGVNLVGGLVLRQRRTVLDVHEDLDPEATFGKLRLVCARPCSVVARYKAFGLYAVSVPGAPGVLGPSP